MLLLDFDFSSGSGIIVWIGLCILIIAVSVFLTRWIFRIDTMVHYMKVQTDILIKLAQKQGVTNEEVTEIINKK